MKYDINSMWPSYSEEEVEAVQAILRSGKVNYWTGGEGRKFEKEFADFCGAKYAVALANGTVSVELALRAMDIGPGDEVVVTSRTFIASVSAIIMVGAEPVFADVDCDSQNITPETVLNVMTERTKAIIAVHLAGYPCEMEGLMSLANEHDLYVIEDCAQAHGALYKGRAVGSLGHAGAWSFCQDKIMSTGGEGGMLTTNNKSVFEKAWSFKDHGKSWDAMYNSEHKSGFKWVHESFGTNWRMTEIQSAIGRIQIRKMNEWHVARTNNAEAILHICRQYPSVLRIPVLPDYIEHAWYKCYVFVRPEGLKKGWSRDRIMEEINACGVPCYSGSCSEVYLEKAFDHEGRRPNEYLPVARELGETSLVFMVHPTLLDEDIRSTCMAIERVMDEAVM